MRETKMLEVQIFRAMVRTRGDGADSVPFLATDAGPVASDIQHFITDMHPGKAPTSQTTPSRKASRLPFEVSKDTRARGIAACRC